MSQSSSRLALPYIQPAQAQKHVTHNEALGRLDFLVQLTVESFDAITPPASPEEGEIWALGTGAVDDWAGHDGELAGWLNGGWLFIAPAKGWLAAQDTELKIWTGTLWSAIGVADLQNLPGVGINAASDPVNRLSISSAATLFTHEGAGHQLKLNKAGAADTASLVYQTGFSGRAEMGTAGNDDFTVKVSADGTTWTDALVAQGTDGRIKLPGGAHLADGAAAAPALGFSAEGDSGLWRAGNQAIGIGTSGTERVRVTDEGISVTGRLTGTAVTQSAIDNTAGRMLKTGDFGIGTAITLTADDDLDTLTGAGLYYNPDSANCAGNNYPVASAGMVSNQRHTATQWVQHFVSGGGAQTAAALQQFTRSYGASGWGPWVAVLHQGRIVGTVEESAGLPTGAIIERGANANGSYVRFADGTQICTITITDTLAINVPFFGGNRCGNQTWVFPASFATGGADPTMVGAPLNGTAFGVVFNGALGSTQAGWNVTAITTQASASRKVNLTAVGRWF